MLYGGVASRLDGDGVLNDLYVRLQKSGVVNWSVDVAALILSSSLILPDFVL